MAGEVDQNVDLVCVTSSAAGAKLSTPAMPHPLMKESVRRRSVTASGRGIVRIAAENFDLLAIVKREQDLQENRKPRCSRRSGRNVTDGEDGGRDWCR